MATNSCPVVVARDYCYDKEVQLQLKGEWLFHRGGFTIKDVDGNDVFQVAGIAIAFKQISSLLQNSSNFWTQFSLLCYTFMFLWHLCH